MDEYLFDVQCMGVQKEDQDFKDTIMDDEYYIM